jgi:hypothetical protein
MDHQLALTKDISGDHSPAFEQLVGERHLDWGRQQDAQQWGEIS